MESQVIILLFAPYLTFKAFYGAINIKHRLKHKTQNKAFKAHLRMCFKL